jgi:hypothetical protein
MSKRTRCRAGNSNPTLERNRRRERQRRPGVWYRAHRGLLRRFVKALDDVKQTVAERNDELLFTSPSISSMLNWEKR